MGRDGHTEWVVLPLHLHPYISERPPDSHLATPAEASVSQAFRVASGTTARRLSQLPP